MSTSSTTISGNVTQDPELTFASNGAARLSFGVAVNQGYTDAQGEKVEKVSFFNVTAWRYLAENTARVLEKGIGVVVSGRLEQRSYEDKEGNKRSVVDLIAEEIGIATRSLETVQRRVRTDSPQNTTATKSTNKIATSARTRPAVSVGADTDEPF